MRSMNEHASRRMDMHEWLAHGPIGVGLCAGPAMVGERVSRARISLAVVNRMRTSLSFVTPDPFAIC